MYAGEVSTYSSVSIQPRFKKGSVIFLDNQPFGAASLVYSRACGALRCVVRRRLVDFFILMMWLVYIKEEFLEGRPYVHSFITSPVPAVTQPACMR